MDTLMKRVVYWNRAAGYRIAGIKFPRRPAENDFPEIFV
jgi:hypothetical protein